MSTDSTETVLQDETTFVIQTRFRDTLGGGWLPRPESASTSFLTAGAARLEAAALVANDARDRRRETRVVARRVVVTVHEESRP